MEGTIFEEFDIKEMNLVEAGCITNDISKKVITEISLKVIVNGEELVSLLCLNQYQEELAIGFLYNEGVINSYEDIKGIYYNERLFAVVVDLEEGVLIDRQESLRSVTSGCGKCFTYINPQKKKQYSPVNKNIVFSGVSIIEGMKIFLRQSEIFKEVGGVHSVLLHSEEFEILTEDIGRHNAFDKITGVLLKNNKLTLIEKSVVYLSGRISSEIMIKAIRLGIPVIISRSTPTAAGIRLAEEYNITLLGYVRGDRGYIYTFPDRISS